MSQKSGMGDRSVVMWVVIPSIRLDGMAASAIQRRRRGQVNSSSRRWIDTAGSADVVSAGRVVPTRAPPLPLPALKPVGFAGVGAVALTAVLAAGVAVAAAAAGSGCGSGRGARWTGSARVDGAQTRPT